MNYKNRFIEKTVKEAVASSGAVVVTGPRQSGKTSLLNHLSKQLFGDQIKRISFDTPSEIDAFRRDPDLFFSNHPGRLFFDEVQHVPDLFPYIKRELDKRPGAFRFFLSGSQSFGLIKGISESLAGRAVILDLWPFCIQEIRHRKKHPWSRLLDFLEQPSQFMKIQGKTYPVNDTNDVVPCMIRGGYPPAALHDGGRMWLESYRRTYLERDVRLASPVQDLGRFDRFLTLVAGRSGTVLNKAELSNALDIDNKTVDHWLGILEMTYQTIRLPPYFINTTKRLVKRPKIHFADPGLGLLLQGIRDKESLLSAPHFGNLFESFVIMELRKLYGHAGRMWNAFFWRDAGGKECDVVLSMGGRLIPIEIKHAANIKIDHTRGLHAFMKIYDAQAPYGILLSMAPNLFRITERIWNVPLGLILNGLLQR